MFVVRCLLLFCCCFVVAAADDDEEDDDGGDDDGEDDGDDDGDGDDGGGDVVVSLTYQIFWHRQSRCLPKKIVPKKGHMEYGCVFRILKTFGASKHSKYRCFWRLGNQKPRYLVFFFALGRHLAKTLVFPSGLQSVPFATPKQHATKGRNVLSAGV